MSYIKPADCPHNPEVGCSNPKTCDSCGWNPVVAMVRLDKIRKKLEKGTPTQE